jgi:hypothetical protein
MLVRLREQYDVLEAPCDRIDLAGGESGKHGGVLVAPDQRHDDAFFGEEALILRDKQRPIANIGKVEDSQRLGLGRLGAACR